MLIVEGVLKAEELARVTAALAGASFVDGRATASGSAQSVKQNRETPQGDPALAELRGFVQRTLSANGQVASYARPVRWAEDRQGLRQHDADGIVDASEMERQVRDQLYGPGFRRR